MAIQVNGTTVINNSRALTNIASVDSTTATAIGNAGVGGLTTVLVDNGSVNASRLSIDFTGGYDRYIVSLSKITPSSNGVYFYMRLKNSSGSDITSNTYGVVGTISTGNGYGDADSNVVYLVSDSVSTNEPINGVWNFWYPYSTSRHTFGESASSCIRTTNSIRNSFVAQNFIQPSNTLTPARHNGAYFYFTSGNIVGNYSVWGVNN